MLATGFALVALVVQLVTLPSMRALGAARLETLATLLVRTNVALALFAILMVFCGHFTFFSYVRPFLETMTSLAPFGITVILLIFGVGTFAGNSLASLFIRTSLRATLVLLPLLMSGLAVVLSVLGGTMVVDALMVGAWGMAFGVLPVAWSTWITEAMSDEAESGEACWSPRRTSPSLSAPALVD